MKRPRRPVKVVSSPASPGSKSSVAGPEISDPGFFSVQISRARRFCLDLNPPSSLDLAVVCGGCEHCEPTYHVNRSSFKYFSVEFVAQGRGTLKLGSQSYALGPGDVFAYGPGVKHDMQSDLKQPLVKYFVDFCGHRSTQLLKPPGVPPGSMIQTSNPEQVLRLYEDLITTALRRSVQSSRIAVLILEQLLLRIGETAVPPGSVGTQAFVTYQSCRRFIEDHYLELETLGDIADGCFVDPAYLCRLFHRFDDQSPCRYLTRLKILDAAERLQTRGAMVKQVAKELNFRDAFDFSRVFRRVMGVSPRVFARLPGISGSG